MEKELYIDYTIQTLIIEAINNLEAYCFDVKFIILGVQSANELYKFLLEEYNFCDFPSKFFDREIIINPTVSDTYVGVLPSNEDAINAKCKNLKFFSRE